MKNLKRVLSLGLASVMLLGMMVMGASAKDFTDADKIVNGEAVQVLVALKIVNGKEDGSYFDPEGTVTRGEMAKMIAVLMNGGSEANTGVKGTPSFTDIGGHWAEGWIEYCADMGIIGGRGDGTFDPNGLVTGTEALKMVLTALGYDAVAYKLQGAGWAAQTIENARKTGNKRLTDDLSKVVMTEPATRDTAAQMIWNGLQAYTVDISPDKNTSSGEVTWGYDTTQVTLLQQRYDAVVKTGTFEGTSDYVTSGTKPAKGNIVVTLAGAPEAFPYDMDIDYVGEEVKVVWKDGPKSVKANAPDKNDEIFGVFVTGATRVERTTMGKVKDHKNSKQEINLNGTVCAVADSVQVIKNYNSSDTYTATKAPAETTPGDVKGIDEGRTGGTGKNSNLTGAIKGDRGDAIKAVFDGDGKVYRIYITETVPACVTSINGVNITLSNGVNNIKIADNDVEEGLKKGDVVMATTLYGANAQATGAKTTVKKAEKVSGEVEGYLVGTDNGTNATETITLSGKKYTVYMKANMLQVPETDKDVETLSTGDTQNTYIGKDFDLYLVNGYVAAAIKTSATANNYSLITEVKDSGTAGSVFSGVQLQVMGADGTKEIISVSKDSANVRGDDGVITYDDYMVGDIVTYSFDKNDMAEVKVESMVAAADADKIYNETTKYVTGKVTASDCVLFVKTEGVAMTGTDKNVANAEWEAYNIRDLDDITLESGKYFNIVMNSTNTKAVAVFMELDKEPDGAADDTVYGVISAYNGRIGDYWLYTVQSNGEEYEIKSKDNTTVLGKGKLVKFRPTVDNAYSAGKVKVYAASAGLNKIVPFIGWVDEFSDKDRTLIYFDVAPTTDDAGNYTVTGDNKIYALAKDAVIVYVNVNDSKSESEANVDHYNEYSGTSNVAFTTKVVDNETVIDVMFVETSTKQNVNKNIK